ncbi:MAG: hypothetical protein ACKVTZ_00640 [Bacteroidia bacterium]
MKFTLKIILIMLAALLFEEFVGGIWWGFAFAVALVAILMSPRPRRKFSAKQDKSFDNDFLAGFIGVALLWALAAFWKDYNNNSILGGRMAELFSIPSTSLLIVVVSLVGGLVGGLASLTGGYLGEMLKSQFMKRR